MKILQRLLLTAVFVMSSLAGYAQPGALDLSFGEEGKLSVGIRKGSEVGRNVAVQPDGKIVVAGYGESPDGYVCLARYGADGVPDNTFGNEGKVVVPFPNSILEIHDVAVQSDGKIVVAGWINQEAAVTDNDFLIMRFLNDGAIDPGFGTGGWQITDFMEGADRAFAMLYGQDGTCVVAGYTIVGLEYRFAMARYLPDGTLDNTFGGDGKVSTALGGTGCGIFDVAGQPDGKIVVTGYNATGSQTTVAVARYMPNGDLDPSFSDDGNMTVELGPGLHRGTAVALQPDGKLVVGATRSGGGWSDFALCRILPNGAMDTGFDTDGVQNTDFGAFDIAAALKIQSDGTILMAGSSGSDVALARYLPNGALDQSFDGDGTFTFDIREDQLLGLDLQPDGKIVAVGAIWENNRSYFLVMRLLTNGVLDNSFHQDGTLIPTFLASDDVARTVLVQPDTKILAAGATRVGDHWDFALVRCLFDGTPDYSFGQDGQVITDFNGGNDELFGAVQQADGNIVVAGSIDEQYAVARYLANGDLDGSFGNGGFVAFNFSGVYPSSARALAMQPDGKLVLAGEAVPDPANERDFTLVRLTATGAPDDAFGTFGVVRTNFGSGYTDVPQAMVIQPDGKIVVAGYSAHASEVDLAVARYLPNGALDPDFGSAGTLLISDIGLLDYVRALVLQPDGKILLAGDTYLSPTDLDALLVRLNEDGSFDATFGTNGVVKTDLNATLNNAFAMVLQDDGKILTAGYHGYFGNNDFVLQRFLSDGVPDTSFNGSGYVLTDFGGFSDVVYALALQPDGKIVAAGQTRTFGVDYDFALARYYAGQVTAVYNPKNNLERASVFPNPVGEQATVAFTLKEPDEMTIRLLNAEGRIVQTFANELELTAGEQTVWIRLLPDLPEGAYFLWLTGEKGQASVNIHIKR